MRNDFTNMGYSKKPINITYHEIFQLSDAELTLPKILSPTARAIKFITNFNHTFNWSKVQLTLNNLHTNIVQHYTTKGPYQKIVFSNEKNISSFFSNNVKH